MAGVDLVLTAALSPVGKMERQYRPTIIVKRREKIESKRDVTLLFSIMPGEAFEILASRTRSTYFLCWLAKTGNQIATPIPRWGLNAIPIIMTNPS